MRFLEWLIRKNDFAVSSDTTTSSDSLVREKTTPIQTLAFTRSDELQPSLVSSPHGFTGSWRARPIFISSTFRDMHAERDHLRDAVFPELEERLRDRRQNLEPIDLRLGIVTTSLEEQHARELLVLKVCLSEIERSRPFLLVLIGDRYGWVPPVDRISAAVEEAGFTPDTLSKSVTALEIEFGILKNDPEQRRRSLFYFREPLPYDSMSPEDVAVYSDAVSPDPEVRAGYTKLQALKEKIVSDQELGERVRHYQLDWDPAERKPAKAALEAWGRQVLDELWAELDEETHESVLHAPANEDEQERENLDEFVQYKLRDFTGRDDLLAQLLNLARSSDKEAEAWGACVKGESGSGKSSIFAALYRELSGAKADEDETTPLILAHSAGMTPCASRIDTMLRRFVMELAASLGQTTPLKNDASPDEVDQTFRILLRQVSQQRRVVVLIDALNSFELSTRAKLLTWLPGGQWPDNARLIATSQPGQEAESLEQWAGVKEIGIPTLGEKEAAEIANAVWRRYHRECNPDVLVRVLGRRREDGQPACSNPLWLTLAMEQLNLLDADDFKRAGQNLNGLLLEMAGDLPSDVEGLYAAMLARSEKLFGSAWARSFACLTSLSRFGWRESDYKELLPKAAALLFPETSPLEWDALQFAALRRSFRAQLMQRGEHGRWDFSHVQMREAVKIKYLDGTSLIRKFHKIILDHLLSLSRDDKLRGCEAMHHLIKANDVINGAKFYGETSPAPEATKTLAQFIKLNDPDNSTTGLEWIFALLHRNKLNENANKILCYNIQRHLAEELSISSNTNIVMQLRHIILDYLNTYTGIHPNDGEMNTELGLCLFKIGGILLNTGNHLKSLEMLRRGVESLTNKGNKFEDLIILAQTYIRIGDIRHYEGYLTEAYEYYERSKIISETLLNNDSTNPASQLIQSTSYSCLSLINKDLGNLTEALNLSKKALDISKLASETNRLSSPSLLELSTNYHRTGLILILMGKNDTGLALFESSLEIIERLIAREPTSIKYEIALAEINVLRGLAYLKINNKSESKKSLDASINIYEQIKNIDQMNVLVKTGIAVSYQKIGECLLSQFDFDGSQKAYQASINILQDMIKNDTANHSTELILATSYWGISYSIHKFDRSNAKETIHAALKIADKLLTTDQKNINLLLLKARCHTTEGFFDLLDHNFSNTCEDIKLGIEFINQILEISKSLEETEQLKSTIKTIADGLLESYDRTSKQILSSYGPLNAKEIITRACCIDIKVFLSLTFRYIDLAHIYLSINSFDLALQTFLASKELRNLIKQHCKIFNIDEEEISRNNDRHYDAIESRFDICKIHKLQNDIKDCHMTLSDSGKVLIEIHAGLAMAHLAYGEQLFSDKSYGTALEQLKLSLPSIDFLINLHHNKPVWQKRLAICYIRIGEILRLKGDLIQSLEAYKTCSILFENLIKSGTEDTNTKINLASSYSWIAVILKIKGNNHSAIPFFRLWLEVLESMPDENLSIENIKHDLFAANAMIGELLYDEGDFSGAEKSWHDGLQHSEKFHLSDKNNIFWLQCMASMHDRLKTLARRQDDLRNSLTHANYALLLYRLIYCFSSSDANAKKLFYSYTDYALIKFKLFFNKYKWFLSGIIFIIIFALYYTFL